MNCEQPVIACSLGTNWLSAAGLVAGPFSSVCLSGIRVIGFIIRRPRSSYASGQGEGKRHSLPRLPPVTMPGMSDERKPVWPWIVGLAGMSLASLALGATCFFGVLWLARNNFGRPVSNRPPTAEGRR